PRRRGRFDLLDRTPVVRPVDPRRRRRREDADGLASADAVAMPTRERLGETEAKEAACQSVLAERCGGRVVLVRPGVAELVRPGVERVEDVAAERPAAPREAAALLEVDRRAGGVRGGDGGACRRPDPEQVRTRAP